MKFLFGLAIGVVLGLLYAPARGEQTRKQLLDQARQLSELPERKASEIAEDAKDKAGELGARLGRQAAEAAVESATSGLTGTATDKSA